MISLNEAAKIYGVTATRLRQIIDKNRFKIEKSPGVKGTVSIPSQTMQKLNKLRGVSFDRRIITVGIEKGGVGKTTVSAMLASAAARTGRSVLCCDFDPECCLSQFLFAGEIPDDAKSILEVFEDNKQIIDYVQPTVVDGVDCLPAKVWIRRLERIISDRNPATLLKGKMGGLLEHYDLIIFDVPPTWNKLVSSAYISSNLIIMPVNSDIFSLDSLHLTIEDVEDCAAEYRVQVPEIRILRNKYGASRINSKQLDNELSRFGAKLLPLHIKSAAFVEHCINSSSTVFSTRRKEALSVADSYSELLDVVSPTVTKGA